jgi:hypothetical protein
VILNASIQQIIQNWMTNAHTLQNTLPLKYFSVTEVHCVVQKIITDISGEWNASIFRVE